MATDLLPLNQQENEITSIDSHDTEIDNERFVLTTTFMDIIHAYINCVIFNHYDRIKHKLMPKDVLLICAMYIDAVGTGNEIHSKLKGIDHNIETIDEYAEKVLLCTSQSERELVHDMIEQIISYPYYPEEYDITTMQRFMQGERNDILDSLRRVSNPNPKCIEIMEFNNLCLQFKDSIGKYVGSIINLYQNMGQIHIRKIELVMDDDNREKINKLEEIISGMDDNHIAYDRFIQDYVMTSEYLQDMPVNDESMELLAEWEERWNLMLRISKCVHKLDQVYDQVGTMSITEKEVNEIEYAYQAKYVLEIPEKHTCCKCVML